MSEPISLRSRPYGADELSPGYDHLRARTARRERGAGLHIALFLLTFACAAATHALFQGIDVFRSPIGLVAGLPYAAALMAILLFHESGHYVLARLHRIDATLPYFIPGPYPLPFGTLGAFIRMRTMPRDRRALFDVGAAGPWAGIFIAIPVLILGLSLSEVKPLSAMAGSAVVYGDPLLLQGLIRLVLGVWSSEVAVMLHPIAEAGWVGLLVTALNLMPVGQLDGGHVIYAALGPRWHRFISLGMLTGLLVLGLSGQPSWLVWAALLAVLGTRHPSLLDERTPLDGRRLVGAAATVLLFVVTFIPEPISRPTPPPAIQRSPDAIAISAPAPITRAQGIWL
ncbi:MAG: site-2 protease family protein [Deltaproteobacteria bacterium]|nr:site-2 protease family protein [Deltaproteobacteria bacterium]